MSNLRTFPKERIDAASMLLMQAVERFLNNKHLHTQDELTVFLTKVNGAQMAMANVATTSDETIAWYCQDVIDYVDTLYS
jgi:regulator of sigma D